MNDVVFRVVALCYVAIVLVCYLLYHMARTFSKSKCSPFSASGSKDLALRWSNGLERNAAPILFTDVVLRSASAPRKNMPGMSSVNGLTPRSTKTLEKNVIPSQETIDDREMNFFASFSAMIESAEHQLKYDFDKALEMVDALENYFDHVLLEKVNILETKVKRL